MPHDDKRERQRVARGLRAHILAFCIERGPGAEFFLSELTTFVQARQPCAPDSARRIFTMMAEGDGEPKRIAYEIVDRQRSRWRLIDVWPEGKPAERGEQLSLLEAM